MKYDVFISYSRKDFDEVSALIETIRAEIPGLSMWFDITGIESGDEFEEKIISAIDDSSYVLFALSDNALESQWTKDEVIYAKNTGKKIIPILLKGASLKGWFLFKFGRVDCIDFSNPLQKEKLLKNLSDWTGKTRSHGTAYAPKLSDDSVTKYSEKSPRKATLQSVPQSTPQQASQLKQKKTLPRKFWLSGIIISVIFIGAICLSHLDQKSQLSEDSQLVFEFVDIESELEPAFEEVVVPTGDFILKVKGVEYPMVFVEGGTFMMGSDDSDAFDWQKPVHSVTLSGYCIGKYEVTQELWEAVMGSNPSYFQGSRRPVEQVSWEDCQEFIRKLNNLTGQNFKLPTEAQWEFAARGGKKSRGYKYSGSNNISAVAWYYGNSGDETHDVGTKTPNELGLYDMSGNVREWCSDRFGMYESSPQTDPLGPSSGSHRVSRVGSWGDSPRSGRVYDRYNYSPVNSNYSLGLRLCL